jgi:hypothetical protein
VKFIHSLDERYYRIPCRKEKTTSLQMVPKREFLKVILCHSAQRKNAFQNSSLWNEEDVGIYLLGKQASVA